MIFTKTENYDHLRFQRQKNKFRAKFFQNGNVENEASNNNSSAHNEENLSVGEPDQKSVTCEDSEITLILQKFEQNGQFLYKFDDEFKKPSPQLRLSDGRAKLII